MYIRSYWWDVSQGVKGGREKKISGSYQSKIDQFEGSVSISFQIDIIPKVVSTPTISDEHSVYISYISTLVSSMSYDKLFSSDVHPLVPGVSMTSSCMVSSYSTSSFVGVSYIGQTLHTYDIDCGTSYTIAFPLTKSTVIPDPPGSTPCSTPMKIEIREAFITSEYPFL